MYPHAHFTHSYSHERHEKGWKACQADTKNPVCLLRGILREAKYERWLSDENEASQAQYWKDNICQSTRLCETKTDLVNKMG